MELGLRDPYYNLQWYNYYIKKFKGPGTVGVQCNYEPPFSCYMVEYGESFFASCWIDVVKWVNNPYSCSNNIVALNC